MGHLALLLLTLLVSAAKAQFNPSCSFTSGQCIYSVQLGHVGQCDTAVATEDGQCCGDLRTQVTGLASDVSTLKSQVSELLSELMATKANLSNNEEQLTESELHTQQLLELLAAKEAELNATQSQLATIIQQAGEEIQTLRSTVSNLTTSLNTCRGTLGLATGGTAEPIAPPLPADLTMTFCDFENRTDTNDTMCGYTQERNSLAFWSRGQGRQSIVTGPVEDHTYGAPTGHYAFLDAVAIGSATYVQATRNATMTSPEYPPASGYCIKFWYNMNGNDVKDLRVYAKIHSGLGYPVFSRTGPQGQAWHLAEVDLDREYTATPFNLVFEATTSAYRNSYTQFALYGDIAIDDIYVYNTRCYNIPRCSPNAIMRQDGGETYCYSFHVQAVTWYEAADVCRKESATTSLVTVTSENEQDFLVQTILADEVLTAAGQYGFYTGGNDEQAEGNFSWTDLGNPYQMVYTNWNAGQPNNVASDQNCLLLEYPELDFKWGDVDCDERHPFICENHFPTSITPLVG